MKNWRDIFRGVRHIGPQSGLCIIEELQERSNDAEVALISETLATDIPPSFRVSGSSLTATERPTDHSSDIVQRRAVLVRVERSTEHLEKAPAAASGCQ